MGIHTRHPMSPAQANDERSKELRRCGSCGEGTVRCVEVVQHRDTGVATGRTYTFACDRCSLRMTVGEKDEAPFLAAMSPILGGTFFGGGLIGSAWFVRASTESPWPLTAGGVSILVVFVGIGAMRWGSHASWQRCSPLVAAPE